MLWRTDNPPKDGSPVLGCFGKRKEISVCIWNSIEKNWIVPIVQANLYKGKWNDYYYESISETDKELNGWIELPEYKGE